MNDNVALLGRIQAAGLCGSVGWGMLLLYVSVFYFQLWELDDQMIWEGLFGNRQLNLYLGVKSFEGVHS